MNYFAGSKYEGGRYQFNSLLFWMQKAGIDLSSKANTHPSFTVLDSGCGDGAMSEHLLQTYPFFKVVGFDISEKQIEGAIKRCAKFTDRSQFIVAGFDEFKITTTVDFVLASFSLHLAPSIERAVANITAPLKSGGEFFAVIPVIAPFMSIIYRDLVEDPRFKSSLLYFADKIHDIHPNGLRFWEQENPTWREPDMVAGFTRIAIAAGFTPLVCQLVLKHTVMTEQDLDHLILGINPFLDRIPENLRAEFSKLSVQSAKKGMIITVDADGTQNVYVQELSFYGIKK